VRVFVLAQLPVRGRSRNVGKEETRHVDAHSCFQSFVVLPFAISIRESREPVPAGMIGIQFGAHFHLGATLFPLAGVRAHQPQKCERRPVHAIERDATLRGRAEGQKFLLEEMSCGQGTPAKMIRGRKLNGSLRRRLGAAKRVGLDVETLRVFAPVKHGQHGPAIGLIGSLVDGAF